MNLNPLNKELYFSLANCIRSLSMDMVEAANSGHPGMPMGMADVVTVLFKDFLSSTHLTMNGQTVIALCFLQDMAQRCCIAFFI